MNLTDLPKDVRRFLLAHWTADEITSRLQDPEYFFEQVVSPRLDYLRRSGEDLPHLRIQKTPAGELRVAFLS